MAEVGLKVCKSWFCPLLLDLFYFLGFCAIRNFVNYNFTNDLCSGACTESKQMLSQCSLHKAEVKLKSCKR